AAPGERLKAPGELIGAQRAQVPAVEVAQLLLVEDRRVLGDALEAEALGQLREAEELLIGGKARAEQRDVVVDRLGQITGVAQFLDRGGAVALGELLAVGAIEE